MTPLARRLTALPFGVTRDLFHPDLPVEEVYRAFENRRFQEIARGGQTIAYNWGDYVLKVPVFKLALGEEDHQVVYGNPITAGLLTFLNLHGDQWEFWRLAKKGMKLALHGLRPQRVVVPEEELRGYRIGIEKAPELITPSRIVRTDRFSLKRRWIDPDAIDFPEEAVLQRRVARFLIDRLRQADRDADWPLISGLLTSAFDLHVALWKRGVADLDCGINILSNVEVQPNDGLRLVDCGSLSDDLDQTLSFIEQANAWADEARRKLERNPLSTSVKRSLCLTLQKLRRNLSGEGFERAGRDFVRLTARTFTPENLRRHWPGQLS